MAGYDELGDAHLRTVAATFSACGKSWRKGIPQQDGAVSVMAYLTGIEVQVGSDTVHPIPFCMKGIVAFLIADHQEDDQGGGQAHGQAQDIQERKSLLPPKRTERDFYVVAKHGYCVLG